MATLSKSKEEVRHEIWGIIAMGTAIIAFLSLLTYDAGDLWLNQNPPNSPQRNLIGPLGAWLGNISFFTIGLAAFFAPIAVGALGIALFRRETSASLTGKFAWTAALIVFTAILFQLFFGTPRSQFAPIGAGGWIGSLVADMFLRSFLSRTGAILLMATAWAVALVLLTGFHPSVHGIEAWQWLTSKWGWKSARKTEKSKPETPEYELKDYLADRERLSKESSVITDTALPPPPVTHSAKPGQELLASSIITDEPVVKPKPKPRVKKEALPPPPPPMVGDYEFPPVSLLNPPPPLGERQIKDDLKVNAEILAATLRDFNIEVTIGEVQRGPVITRYEICPAPGVRVERIAALNNNIALAMRATQVRIQTPIPGKGTVGIEVPNSTTAVVYLRELIESDEWKARRAKIPIALGKDISGNSIVADLTEMPHMLIAGATGAGKTVCVNALITSLLFHSSPTDLRLVMIDPKIVEMQMYSRLPHLWMPIVTDAKKVPLALRKLLDEMEHRYRVFARVGVRNISGFNSRPDAEKPAKKKESDDKELFEEGAEGAPVEPEIPAKLPYIVVFVDELADVMMVAGKDVEMAVARLAQLARATGIHMVLSTQRPSVDVITGVIKANFPARVAFQVASKQDSRVILDANGADKLIGKGDMLYLPPGSSRLTRAQATYVQDDEIRRVVDFIEKRCPAAFEPEQIDISRPDSTNVAGEGEEEDEELVEQCIEVLQQTKRASTSMLQRRLGIGYNRAARIMDILEQRGIVGPNKGAAPREILVDLDEDPLGDEPKA